MAFQDAKNLYLVMDYHPGGDLLSLLSAKDDIFDEAFALPYLAEIAMAIHALHQLGYVHRLPRQRQLAGQKRNSRETG